MDLEIFTLTLFVLFHTACSFSDMIYQYGYGGLLDFDENDPFVESMKPEEISQMELKRLKKFRRPRNLIHEGGFILNPDAVKGLGTEIPNVRIERNHIAVDDVKKKKQEVSRSSVLQNLKNVDAPFGPKNPFRNLKKYHGEDTLNVFRDPTSLEDINDRFKIIATPYMRNKWEPNFLRAVDNERDLYENLEIIKK